MEIVKRDAVRYASAERQQARRRTREVYRDAAAVFSDQRCVLVEDGRGQRHTRQPLHAPQQVFVQAIGVAREQLQARRSRDAADDRAGGVGDAAVRDLHSEHEGHADRDPSAGEQLLHGTRAQPPAVEVEEP